MRKNVLIFFKFRDKKMQESKNRHNFTVFSSDVPWAKDFANLAKYTNSLNKNSIGEIEKKKEKKKKNAEIIHPIFKEFEEMTDDEYWKMKLHSFAIGKFGKGFQFANNVLTYKIKNKAITISFDDNDLEDSLKQLIIFLNDKVGIISQKDEMKKKELLIELDETNMKIEINSWSVFKKESQINNAIFNFISNFNDGMDRDLFVNEKKKLEDTIRKGIVAGYFNSNTIIVNDGEIESIYGLKIINENDKYDFEIDKNKVYGKSKCSSSAYGKGCYDSTTLGTLADEYDMVVKENKNSDEILYKQWVKFIKNVSKKISKYKK